MEPDIHEEELNEIVVSEDYGVKHKNNNIVGDQPMQTRRLLATLLFMSLKLRTPLLLFMLGFFLTNFDCHIIMLPVCNICNCGTNNPWRRLSDSLLWLDEGENRALLTNLNSPGSRQTDNCTFF